jgi:hypothetical protein
MLKWNNVGHNKVLIVTSVFTFSMYVQLLFAFTFFLSKMKERRRMNVNRS